MVMFEINLLKHRAISAPVRKVMFWGVSLYLVLCISALAWLANWGTHRLLRAARLRESVDELELQFQKTHHRTQDVLEFARRAKSRLEVDAQSLETIDGLIRHRVSLIDIVSALSGPLPARVHLLNFRLSRKTESVEFDIVVPTSGPESRLRGVDLMSLWNANASLRANLNPVRAISTERHTVHGQSSLVMRFTAKLK